MSRFSRLSAELAAKGAHNPDALAAYIGRKKYGRAGMAALAAKGRATHHAVHAATRADNSGVEYRAFVPELELRASGDGRTVVGIAVPYGRPTFINPGLTEQFRAGAFAGQLQTRGAAGVFPWHRVPFAYGHLPTGGRPIGKTALLRDDAAGLYGEWKVSKTPAGDETLELIRDGVLSELSVGFKRGTDAYLPGGITERVTAELREVAVVPMGAYGQDATIAALRAAGLPYAAPVVSERTRAEEARRYLSALGLANGK